jgi:hypothetical protein
MIIIFGNEGESRGQQFGGSSSGGFVYETPWPGVGFEAGRSDSFEVSVDICLEQEGGERDHPAREG